MKSERVLTAVVVIALALCMVTTMVSDDADASGATVEVVTAQGLFEELTEAGQEG